MEILKMSYCLKVDFLILHCRHIDKYLIMDDGKL